LGLIYMAMLSGDYYHVRLVLTGGREVKVLIAGESIDLHADLYEMLYALDFVHAVYQTEREGEALHKLRTERIDVMILYMGLKSGNWVRLLIETRKEEDAPDVLMLGGRAHPIVQLICIRLGADHFIDTSRHFYQIPAILSELEGRNVVRSIA
jgi:DNA-binding response OmpR family regulator